MLDMVFAIKGGDVRTSKSAATGKAYKIETTEVVGLAKWVLTRSLVGNGKEFGGDDFAAFLNNQSRQALTRVKMVHTWQVKQSK